MLFLVFQLDEDRYAIDASRVVSVLPLVKAKAIPHAPAAVSGAFDYHGEPVPLIDLSRLALGPVALTGLRATGDRDRAAQPDRRRSLWLG